MSQESQPAHHATPPATAAPAPSATPSIAAIVSLTGAIVLFVLHMTVRLYAVLSSRWNVSFDWAALVGVLGLLSLLPIISTIVFGHVGVGMTKRANKRGRVAAIVGATLGYVLLVLYVNRLILVIVAMAQSNDWGRLPQYFMYYV